VRSSVLIGAGLPWGLGMRGDVTPMLLSHRMHTEYAYPHDDLRNSAVQWETSKIRASVCEQAESPMSACGRIRNLLCLLFRQDAAVGHYRQCQYSRFIGRLSSHVVSDVAARWSPEARVLCSPVVVCYGFWRSEPHQV